MKNFLAIVTFLYLGISASAQSTLCPSTSINFGYEYVQSVTLNGVTFAGNTGFAGPGYYDYTGTSMPIFVANTTVPLSVVVKTNGNYRQYIKLWIDFNNNGNLEDAGELVYDQNYMINNTTYTFMGNFTVPPTAFNGPVRMRLIMVYNNTPVLCGNYSFGNTFDFGNSVQGGVNPVKLTVATTGTGSVLSSPSGINSSSGYTAANFAENSTVSLTATATSPQLFAGWTGDITSSANPITVTMDVAKTLTANFASTPLPTISNFNNLNKLLFDDSFVIAAPTSNSTGAFTYVSSNTAVATISGNTVTILSTGTSTITANQAATGSYSTGSTSALLTVSSVNVITRNGQSSAINKIDYMDSNGKKAGNSGLTRYGEKKITKSNQKTAGI